MKLPDISNVRPMGLPPTPLLAAAAQAQGNRQIQEEIKRDVQPRARDFNAAVQNRLRASLILGEGGSQIDQPAQPEIQQQQEQQRQDLSPDRSNEEQPLLQNQGRGGQNAEQAAEQIIQAADPEAQGLLNRNRDRLMQLYAAGNWSMTNADQIKKIADSLHEYFYVNPKEKRKEQAFGEPQMTVLDKAIPKQCRVQYFWNEQKQKIERIMICTDEDGDQRVYYDI